MEKKPAVSYPMDIDKRHQIRRESYDLNRAVEDVMEVPEGERDLSSLSLHMAPKRKEFIVTLESSQYLCDNPEHEAYNLPIDECIEDECVMKYIAFI